MSLSHPLRLFAALAVFALGGCVAIETLAPPVTPAMVSTARASTADLEAGRRIYVGRCASCHSIDPVAKYTTSRWREIVDDMADRTELSASDRSALLAYISAAKSVAP